MYKLRLFERLNGMLVTIDGKVHIARKLVDATGQRVDGFLEVLGLNEPTLCHVGSAYLNRGASEKSYLPQSNHETNSPIPRGLFYRMKMGLIKPGDFYAERKENPASTTKSPLNLYQLWKRDLIPHR